MKGRIAGLAGFASLAALAGVVAGAAAAQTSTTIIEHHKVVREEPAPPPAPPPATVVQKQVSVTHTVKTSGPARPAPHRVVVRKKTPAHARTRTTTVAERTTAVAQPPRPPAPATPPVATVDRRTVIHQDEAGDVHAHTRVERQDANGDTTVIHKSTDIPADQPPPVQPAPLP